MLAPTCDVLRFLAVVGQAIRVRRGMLNWGLSVGSFTYGAPLRVWSHEQIVARHHRRVVDDDPDVRDSLGVLLKSAGLEARLFDSATAFLAGYRPGETGCVVADIRMPDMDGIALQTELASRKTGCR